MPNALQVNPWTTMSFVKLEFKIQRRSCKSVFIKAIRGIRNVQQSPKFTSAGGVN